MSMNVFFLCGCIVAAAIAAWVHCQSQRKRLAIFATREVLSLTELHQAHFSDSERTAVLHCLATVSRVTGIDAGRLRPSDRFVEDLSLPSPSFVAGEWDDLDDELGNRCQHIHTIRDYIIETMREKAAKAAKTHDTTGESE